MSVQFDGTAQTLRTSAYDAWNYNAAWTVSGWFRPQTSATWEAVWAIWLDSNNYETLELQDAVSHFLAGSAVGGSTTGSAEQSGSTYTSGTWYFVAVRRVSSTQINLYVNDTVVATGSSSDVSARTAADYFGIASWAGGSGGTPMRMAQVRIWTTNLTDGELATEKASTTMVKSANRWAEYRLVDATPATVVVDATGNGHTLTLTGSPTTGADDPPNGSPSTTVTVTATRVYS